MSHRVGIQDEVHGLWAPGSSHSLQVACVAGVRRGRKEERRAREAREDRTREDRVPSPSRAHFDFPPFLRPATQASLQVVRGATRNYSITLSTYLITAMVCYRPITISLV